VVVIHASLRLASLSQLDVLRPGRFVVLGMFAVVEVRVAGGLASPYVLLLVVLVSEGKLAAQLAPRA
jgi:hypothetical protein